MDKKHSIICLDSHYGIQEGQEYYFECSCGAKKKSSKFHNIVLYIVAHIQDIQMQSEKVVKDELTFNKIANN
jgi:hypothetical protein